MKINESKTDNGRDQEKVVSMKISETNFKAPKLSDEERKHTEIKPRILRSVLGNRKNTAPGHDGIMYEMINQLP